MQRNNLYIFLKLFSFFNAQIQTLNYYIISISKAFVNHKKWNRIIFYSTSLSTYYLQAIVVYKYHFIHRIYAQSNCILLVCSVCNLYVLVLENFLQFTLVFCFSQNWRRNYALATVIVGMLRNKKKQVVEKSGIGK